MSEILRGNRSTASPVSWRRVALADTEGTARRLAEEELERGIELARRDGTERGLESGRADAQRQVPATIDNISTAISELERIRERLHRQTERDLIRLAVTVAERVIHRETVLDPDALAGLVKAAFGKVQARDVARVRMHPALEPVVTKTLDACGAREMVVMPDSSLKPGELLFETSQGVLDASVHTQLSEIERSLLDQLGAGPRGN
jgi:flagellar assembly protein FliH